MKKKENHSLALAKLDKKINEPTGFFGKIDFFSKRSQLVEVFGLIKQTPYLTGGVILVNIPISKRNRKKLADCGFAVETMNPNEIKISW